MKSRRRAREIALQILYGTDANPALDVSSALRALVQDVTRAGTPEEEQKEEEGTAGGVRDTEYDSELAETLVREVTAHRDELDHTITAASRNWRIERMARVDRNILRLAVYELRFLPDIPARVTLNEAIELAKRFGADDSPAFVNGLLDSTVKALNIDK